MSSIEKQLEEAAMKKKEKRNAQAALMAEENQAAAAASANININNDENINNDNNKNIDKSVGAADVDIDDVVDQDRRKTFTKKPVGLYFDADVKRALEKYKKAMGRGAMSELLNDLARRALTQKGYMK